MALSTPSPSRKPQRLSRLEIFPPSVPKCLIRGREISVYYNRQSGGAWARHQRDQVEIALLFSPTVCHLGWGILGAKWYEREMRGPYVCVIASGLPHECRLEGDAELLVLYVESSLLRRVVRRKISGIVMADAAQHDAVIWMLASLLRHLCTGRLRPSARTIDAIGGELTCWLVELLHDSKAAVPPPTGRALTPAQREKVMRYMHANMKHDIHVIDLAKQTGHSVSQFSELFVKTLGRAPYRYLKEMRVLKAYEMLITGDYLAKEVALAVGYSNADHFCEVFQKFSGHTPRELLRRLRAKSADSRFFPEEHRDNSP